MPNRLLEQPAEKWKRLRRIGRTSAAAQQWRWATPRVLGTRIDVGGRERTRYHRFPSADSTMTASINRWLQLAVATVVCVHVAGAQSTGATVPITAPLERQYAGDLTALHDKVMALANAIPADKYVWRPSDQVRTVAQLLMHLAGEWFSLCPLSVASKAPADFGPAGEAMRKLEEVSTKPEVLVQLNKSWAHCRSALDRINPAILIPDSLPAKMGFPRVVLLVSGDHHEHLGQLIAYARSIGVTPPWTK